MIIFTGNYNALRNLFVRLYEKNSCALQAIETKYDNSPILILSYVHDYNYLRRSRPAI